LAVGKHLAVLVLALIDLRGSSSFPVKGLGLISRLLVGLISRGILVPIIELLSDVLLLDLFFLVLAF